MLDTLNSVFYNVQYIKHMFIFMNERRVGMCYYVSSEGGPGIEKKLDDYLETGDFRNEECKDSFMWIYDRMPPRMKLIVDLSMTGSTVKDIAKLLGIDEGTVLVQKWKAKKRLKKLF